MDGPAGPAPGAGVQDGAAVDEEGADREAHESLGAGLLVFGLLASMLVPLFLEARPELSERS